MKTGEGKTFVASLPLYLNALPGTGVHLVTVNDYLAQRDAEWNRGVFERLGMTVAVHRERRCRSTSAQGRVRRRHHLRHELGVRLRLPARQHVDQPRRRRAARPRATRSWTRSTRSSIDEARTPLIISGEPTTAAKTYYDFARIVKGLDGAQSKGTKLEDERARAGARLPLRREAQDGRAERVGHREGRARAADRQPLQPEQRPARQPPDPGAEGARRSTSATSTTSSRTAR